MSDNFSDAIVVNRSRDIHIIQFLVTSLTDQADIQGVGTHLEQLVDQSGYPKLVIDFSGLHNMSSAMLGVLLSLGDKVRARKGAMRLASVPSSIVEVFKLGRLDKVFKIYEDLSDAMHKF